VKGEGVCCLLHPNFKIYFLERRLPHGTGVDTGLTSVSWIDELLKIYINNLLFN
jgi:hypothetical protein